MTAIQDRRILLSDCARRSILWLASVRADGRPHLAPVWFLWEGEAILIFSKPEQQKIRNIRQNPAVTLALDTADDGEDVLVLEGVAALVDDPDLTTALPAYASKYCRTAGGDGMDGQVDGEAIFPGNSRHDYAPGEHLKASQGASYMCLFEWLFQACSGQ